MINQQILAYIKNALEGGQSLEEVKRSLMQMMEFNGWTEAEVEEALRQSQSQPVAEQRETPEPEKPLDSNFSDHVKPKSRFGKILIIVFLSVLFLGGASAYAYFYFFPSPEKVIREMFERQQKIDSFGYESQMDLKISSEKGNAANQRFLIKANGQYDTRDTKNIKSLSVIDANLSGSFLGNLSVGLEARTFGDISYIKATNLPKLGFIDLSSIRNKWIKIDAKDAAKQLGMSGELEKREEEKNKIQSVLWERIGEVTKLFKESGIVQSINELPRVVINGNKTYHYKIVINKGALRDFLLETLKIVNPKQKMSKKELISFNDFFDSLTIKDVEVWIGTEDKLLYGILANFKLQDPKSASNDELTLNIKFNDYNKRFDIKAPTDAKSIQDVLKGSAPLGEVGGLNPAREKALAAKRDADIRQLKFALRMYHDKYGRYPDSLNRLLPEFIPKVPTDPNSGANYKYQPQQDGKGYSLCSQTAKGQKCSFSL